MLDFVVNHTAVDSIWTLDNFICAIKNTPFNYIPDSSRYHKKGVAYGWGGWGAAWKDTFQLNLWNIPTRDMMISSLMQVAALCDGVRCDMAQLALNRLINQNWKDQLHGYQPPATEFWSEAIQTVKSKYPTFIFLAEVYAPFNEELQELGFDFTYDKKLYDYLLDGHLDKLRKYLCSHPVKLHEKSAHFLENHDETRSIDEFKGKDRAYAALAISMTLPGLRFYFMGQECGYTKRLDVHLRRAADEKPDPVVYQKITKLMQVTSRDVFLNGTWNYLNVVGSESSWRLVAWRWCLGSEKRVCVVNYSHDKGSGRVVLDVESGSDDTIQITELLSDKSYARSANELRTVGLMVVLEAWDAQIFSYP